MGATGELRTHASRARGDREASEPTACGNASRDPVMHARGWTIAERRDTAAGSGRCAPRSSRTVDGRPSADCASRAAATGATGVARQRRGTLEIRVHGARGTPRPQAPLPPCDRRRFAGRCDGVGVFHDHVCNSRAWRHGLRVPAQVAGGAKAPRTWPSGRRCQQRAADGHGPCSAWPAIPVTNPPRTRHPARMAPPPQVAHEHRYDQVCPNLPTARAPHGANDEPRRTETR